MDKTSIKIRAELLADFVKRQFFSAGYEIALSLKDRKSGFCTNERVKAARSAAKFTYSSAKASGLHKEFLPMMRETVRKYRK